MKLKKKWPIRLDRIEKRKKTLIHIDIRRKTVAMVKWGKVVGFVIAVRNIPRAILAKY